MCGDLRKVLSHMISGKFWLSVLRSALNHRLVGICESVYFIIKNSM